MTNKYLSCYLALELQPGCSWTQLRGAYRRLVRTWHPDRFQQEPERKVLAEERIKEINQAYEALSSFRKRHGHLPMPDGRQTRSPPADPPPTQRARPQDTPSSEPPAADWESPQPAIKTAKPFRFIRLIGLGIAIWATYSFWSSHRPPADSVTLDATRLSGESALSDTRERAAYRQQIAGHLKFFTIGSSPDDVQAAQGIPTDIRNGVWYYAKSRVYFANGTVSHWIDDPSDPLQTDSGQPPSGKQVIRFTVGSTKAQVRAIQGMPSLETGSEWDYGVSKVYFSGNRVTGWYSSPLLPLRAAN